MNATPIDVATYLTSAQQDDLQAILDQGGTAVILLDTCGASPVGTGLNTHGEFIVTTEGVASTWKRAQTCERVAVGSTAAELRLSAQAWHAAEVALGEA